VRARRGKRWNGAAEMIERATAGKQVDRAVLHVAQKDESFTRHFGKAASDEAMFLLGSISKPINVTAVMILFDQGKFQLDDRVKKFLPAFTSDGRDAVTIRHLLTHVSGLPDQLANNNELRKQHAPLTEFVKGTTRTHLDFALARGTSTRHAQSHGLGGKRLQDAQRRRGRPPWASQRRRSRLTCANGAPNPSRICAKPRNVCHLTARSRSPGARGGPAKRGRRASVAATGRPPADRHAQGRSGPDLGDVTHVPRL
jgi:hypothetical protein